MWALRTTVRAPNNIRVGRYGRTQPVRRSPLRFACARTSDAPVQAMHPCRRCTSTSEETSATVACVVAVVGLKGYAGSFVRSPGGWLSRFAPPGRARYRFESSRSFPGPCRLRYSPSGNLAPRLARFGGLRSASRSSIADTSHWPSRGTAPRYRNAPAAAAPAKQNAASE